MKVHSFSRFQVLTDAGEQSQVLLLEAKGNGSSVIQQGDSELSGVWQNRVGSQAGSACVIEVLVVDGQLLGFDLLRFDVIKE